MDPPVHCYLPSCLNAVTHYCRVTQGHPCENTLIASCDKHLSCLSEDGRMDSPIHRTPYQFTEITRQEFLVYVILET
jgi:hypothetical protein